MVVKTNIEDWEHVFLDTSIIIHLFLFLKNSKDPQSALVNKLVSFLSNNQTKGKKERKFYLSAITLSEILSKEMDDDKAIKIVNAINSEDVEFISFDENVAQLFNSALLPYLSNDSLNRFAKEIGWKTHELVMAREWINRDYMIAMSGISRDVDVFLTTDRKTFAPICKNINGFCAVCEPELFDYNDKYFFTYHPERLQKTSQESLRVKVNQS